LIFQGAPAPAFGPPPAGEARAACRRQSVSAYGAAAAARARLRDDGAPSSGAFPHVAPSGCPLKFASPRSWPAKHAGRGFPLSVTPAWQAGGAASAHTAPIPGAKKSPEGRTGGWTMNISIVLFFKNGIIY